ncbi:hypothetical protein ID866_5464 [Astraeus odoratus]|nr:hypothetical protein ID866_5464 [Astraeus odoratus]
MPSLPRSMSESCRPSGRYIAPAHSPSH